MGVDTLQARTEKDVRSIIAALQRTSGEWIPKRYTGFIGRGKVEWTQTPASSDGVFGDLNEAPAWSARFQFTPGNEHGGAYCDIAIYDRGDHREVLATPGYSMGAGARAKDILGGVSAALQSQ